VFLYEVKLRSWVEIQSSSLYPCRSHDSGESRVTWPARNQSKTPKNNVVGPAPPHCMFSSTHNYESNGDFCAGGKRSRKWSTYLLQKNIRSCVAVTNPFTPRKIVPAQACVASIVVYQPLPWRKRLTSSFSPSWIARFSFAGGVRTPEKTFTIQAFCCTVGCWIWKRRDREGLRRYGLLQLACAWAEAQTLSHVISPFLGIPDSWAIHVFFPPFLHARYLTSLKYSFFLLYYALYIAKNTYIVNSYLILSSQLSHTSNTCSITGATYLSYRRSHLQAPSHQVPRTYYKAWHQDYR
jgi:hypothetical protein